MNDVAKVRIVAPIATLLSAIFLVEFLFLWDTWVAAPESWHPGMGLFTLFSFPYFTALLVALDPGRVRITRWACNHCDSSSIDYAPKDCSTCAHRPCPTCASPLRSVGPPHNPAPAIAPWIVMAAGVFSIAALLVAWDPSWHSRTGFLWHPGRALICTALTTFGYGLVSVLRPARPLRKWSCETCAAFSIDYVPEDCSNCDHRPCSECGHSLAKKGPTR